MWILALLKWVFIAKWDDYQYLRDAKSLTFTGGGGGSTLNKLINVMCQKEQSGKWWKHKHRQTALTKRNSGHKVEWSAQTRQLISMQHNMTHSLEAHLSFEKFWYPCQYSTWTCVPIRIIPFCVHQRNILLTSSIFRDVCDCLWSSVCLLVLSLCSFVMPAYVFFFFKSLCCIFLTKEIVIWMRRLIKGYRLDLVQTFIFPAAGILIIIGDPLLTLLKKSNFSFHKSSQMLNDV